MADKISSHRSPGKRGGSVSSSSGRERRRLPSEHGTSADNRKRGTREHGDKNRKTLVLSICIVLVTVVGIFCAVVLTMAESSSAEKKSDMKSVAAETEPVSGEIDPTGAAYEDDGDGVPALAENVDPSYTMVINRSYPIPANYIAGTGELMTVEGKQMEMKAGEALTQMVAALRATGMSIIIQSGYRTDSDQEYLYNRQIGRQDGNKEKAATISAVPLTSEHQAGLAVDLSVDGTLLESFARTEQGKWLKAHCAEYGYILRYPAGKESVTGIISEPWHFRYVGDPDLAQDIMESGKCMEEYFNQYLSDDDIDPYLSYLP